MNTCHFILFAVTLEFLVMWSPLYASDNDEHFVTVRFYNAPLYPSPQASNSDVMWYQGLEALLVYESRDDWIRVRQGWLRRSDTVSLKEAVEFFTAEIEREPSAFSLSSRAFAYMSRDDLESARQDCDRAVALDATSWIANDANGMLLCLVGEYARSIKAYDIAIEANPKSATLLCHRAVAKDCDGDQAGALKDLRAAVGLDNHCLDAYRARIEILSEREEFENALHDCDSLIASDPALAGSYTTRAAIFVKMGVYDKAVVDCTQAIQRDRNDPRAYNLRACSRLRIKDLEGAKADCDSAILLDPKSAVAFCNRGQYWRMKGDYSRALSDLDHAIAIEPSCILAFRERGYIYSSQGDYLKAIKSLDQVIQLDQTCGDAYAERGRAWHILGNQEKAINDLSESIRCNPNDATSVYIRALARLAKDDLDGAIADCNDVVRMKSHVKEALVCRATAQNNLGEYGKALADLRHAMRLGVREPIALTMAATILATCPDDNLRDGKEAIEIGRMACEMEAWQNPNSLIALSYGYAEAGEFDSAVQYISMAIRQSAGAKSLQERARETRDQFLMRRPYRQPRRVGGHLKSSSEQ